VTSEPSIIAAHALISSQIPTLSALLNVAGVLRDDAMNIAPERRIDDFTPESSLASFQVNAIGPMTMAKHFHSLLTPPRSKTPTPPSIFVNFSARVGSITDNGLGGWSSYRASKAAANAFLKTLSHELKRQNVAVVSVHPGTVDTDLTRAFLSARAKYDVQGVDEAALKLMTLFDTFTVEEHGGKFFDHKGEEVPW